MFFSWNHIPTTGGSMPRRNRQRRSRTKTQAQRIHARRRAQTRVGIDLQRSDQDEIVRKIQSNEAEFADKQSTRITRWIVEYADKKFVAVYDKTRKSLVTVITMEMYEQGKEPIYTEEDLLIPDYKTPESGE
jgi:hypothetical protein